MLSHLCVKLGTTQSRSRYINLNTRFVLSTYKPGSYFGRRIRPSPYNVQTIGRSKSGEMGKDLQQAIQCYANTLLHG